MLQIVTIPPNFQINEPPKFQNEDELYITPNSQTTDELFMAKAQEEKDDSDLDYQPPRSFDPNVESRTTRHSTKPKIDYRYKHIQSGKKYHKIAPDYDWPKIEQGESKKMKKELGETEFEDTITKASFKAAQITDKDIIQIRNAIKIMKTMKNKDRKKRRQALKKLKLKQTYYTSLKQNRFRLSIDDILFRRNKNGNYVPVVPKKLQQQIVEFFHTSNSFHHQGITRMENTIPEYYYWANIRSSIEDLVSQCHSCKLSKAKRDTSKPIRYPRLECETFGEICCDIVGPLPVTKRGHRYILTIMDRFTRYTVAVPLVSQTAESVARALLNNWIYIYGAPKFLLTDNGTNFCSGVIKVVLQTLGVKQRFTSKYHPEANGMIERFHKYLKERLAIDAEEKALDYWKEDDWDDYLAAILYSYNATVHTVSGFSPFKLLYGRDVKLNIHFPITSNIQNLNYRDYEEYLVNFIKQLEIIKTRSFALQYAHYIEMDKKLNMNSSA